MKYAWLGKALDHAGSVVNEGHGTAYRPRAFDGSKNKTAPFVSFADRQKEIFDAVRKARKLQGPVKPRVSRKGNSLSGPLPRLCGY